LGYISRRYIFGPQRDADAPLLEVMIERLGPRTVRVFHVMAARDRFLALAEQEEA
jgi:hypothetical protein